MEFIETVTASTTQRYARSSATEMLTSEILRVFGVGSPGFTVRQIQSLPSTQVCSQRDAFVQKTFDEKTQKLEKKSCVSLLLR